MRPECDTRLFGARSVRLDPWGVDYGAETPAGFEAEPEAGDVVVDVEQRFPFPSWATRQSEVAPIAGEADPFARMGF
jgi:hypothetical protein